MAQDLNTTPQAQAQQKLTPEQMRAIVDSDGNPNVSSWLNGAWNTFSGKTAYSAPENVYNPMAAYDKAPSQQMRGNQLLAQQYYGNALNGTSPSLANEQMKQGIAQGQASQMSAASGARGIDRAAAFRQAQNNAAQMGAQGAIAGGQQRLQEQQQAASGLSNAASQTRQQDVGEQLGLGQLQNQAQQNLNQQYGINAQVQSGNAARQQKSAGDIMSAAGAVVGGLALSDEDSKENVEPALGDMFKSSGSSHSESETQPKSQEPAKAGSLGDFYSSVGTQAQQRAPDPDFKIDQGPDPNKDDGGMMGGMAGGAMGGGALSMMSDENSKENLRGLEHAYQFDYKTPDAHQIATEAARHAYVQAFMDAKEPREGVMAQDLQKDPHTESIVQKSDENERLMLDGKRALGFMLANMGDINKRLSRLEGGPR